MSQHVPFVCTWKTSHCSQSINICCLKMTVQWKTFSQFFIGGANLHSLSSSQCQNASQDSLGICLDTISLCDPSCHWRCPIHLSILLMCGSLIQTKAINTHCSRQEETGRPFVFTSLSHHICKLKRVMVKNFARTCLYELAVEIDDDQQRKMRAKRLKKHNSSWSFILNSEWNH